MAAEIGFFALIISLVIVVLQGTIPLYGAISSANNKNRYENLIGLARPLAYGSFFALTVSILALAYCFYDKDFSVLYVANNSNSLLPVQYRLSAVWGGHEGSLLLWLFMLSAWGAAVAFFSKSLDEPTLAKVLSVIGLVAIGLHLFTALTSNPFERLIPAAAEGRDLNPLLQDPGLIFHPPLLYMGYVGLSVAFAFAISALITGKLDTAWARWSRPWTMLAWVFLSLGIVLGSWWAYYELGWGGWWFWDPVENASLMPWLVATALIHSLAVTEKRGSFKIWTVLLALCAFSLSLLGTFLVRSGVLTSVHAFAVDPTRGLFILIFLVIVIGASLLLFALRAHKVGLGGSFSLLSRETFMLIGNVVIVVSAFVVLLGTMYPMIIDAFRGEKISVGAPYFNTVFVPIAALALLLTAITPHLSWKKHSPRKFVLQIIIPIVIAIIGALIVELIYDKFTLYAFIGMFVAILIFISVLQQSYTRIKQGGVPMNFIGMQVAHFGAAVLVAGITMVTSFEIERTVKMAKGNVAHIDKYTLQLNDYFTFQGANYISQSGELSLIKNGIEISKLYPEKRKFFSSPMPMTEAAIYPTFTHDVFVSMGEQLDDGVWVMTVHYKPFISWIWFGVALFSLGGILAISGKRYRLRGKLVNHIKLANQ